MEKIRVIEMPDMKDGEVFCNERTAYAIALNMKNLQKFTVDNGGLDE